MLITHDVIAAFAENRVNLPSESARQNREQVNRLRERLAIHIAENPGFSLVKMLHAVLRHLYYSQRLSSGEHTYGGV